MARPRTYVPADVIAAAVRAFRRQGYAGTSLDALTRSTGLKRGSLYAAFADKRALFLAALEDYTRSTVGFVERSLAAAADPLEGIAGVLRRVARVATDGEGRHGCLLTNTAAELAGRDREVQAVVAAAFARLEAAYAGALERARAAGQVGGDLDVPGAARLLVATMQGMRVLGQAGAGEVELQAAVAAAVRALSAGAS